MTTDPTDYELEVIQENLQGPPGPRGPAPNTVWSGHGPPTLSIGIIGDYYINVDTWFIYGPRDITGWPTGVSIIGPQGNTGPQGPASNTIYNGSGAPSGLTGVSGDFYIDTTNWLIYGPKIDGSNWGTGVNLVGPAGGQTLRSGSGAPNNSLGGNGDFYIDTTAWKIYGPKASGVWPAGVNIVGPQGATGATGATGAAGSLSPTALGAAANFNSQTTTGWYYTVDTSSTNAPISSHQWYLEVFQANNSSTVMQVATLKDSDPAFKYTRVMIGGTWDSWHPYLHADGNENVTGGFTLTSYNVGNFPSSYTPDPTKGNYQYGTNNGAFTLNNASPDSAITLMVTNSASAGAITFSGYAVASGNAGDNLDTVNGHRFIITLLRINSVSTYFVKALQ